MTDSRPTRVAVVGTVGVPARYGGFETLAEQLAVGVSPRRATLVIYCQRTAYPELAAAAPFAGHRRVFIPMRANGPSSMVHDVIAMLHAAWVARVDVMLVLGNSGAWGLPLIRLLRPRMRVVTNIDGMEWRRAKFGPLARRTLRVLEWFAAKFSHKLIADNAALVPIARAIHGVEPVLIAYGGDHTLVLPDAVTLEPGYYLSIARVEPENNCHLILEASVLSGKRLVFVGNWHSSAYGQALKAKYSALPGLLLLDPIYEQPALAAVRSGAIGYVHGHSVGGTNPSLVEALFHADTILAFDCEFNRVTLQDNGQYFVTVAALKELLDQTGSGRIERSELDALRERYRWKNIVEAYLSVCQVTALAPTEQGVSQSGDDATRRVR